MLNGSALLKILIHVLDIASQEFAHSAGEFLHIAMQPIFFGVSYAAFAWLIIHFLLRGNRSDKQLYECSSMDMTSKLSSSKKSQMQRASSISGQLFVVLLSRHLGFFYSSYMQYLHKQ